MKKNQMLTAALFSIIVLLGFQNCSKIDVSDLDNPTNQKTQGNFEQVLDEEADIAISNDVPASDLPASDLPAEPLPIAKDKEVVPEVEKEIKKEIKEDIAKSEDDESIAEEPTDEEVVMLCLKEGGKSNTEKKKLAETETGTISKLRGHYVIESDHMDLIENVRGKLTVKAKAGGAGTIKKIFNTRGALILCGLEVDSVEDTRGHIVLVNSKVKSLNNHRGNVKLLNSELLDTSDIRGNIKEIQAK